MVASNEWGRVDDDGTVYVRTDDGERVIGSWQAGAPEDGLALYTRKYDDLATEIHLLVSRLDSGAGSPQHTAELAEQMRAALPEAAVIGDIGVLDAQLAELIAKTSVKKEEVAAAKAQARADAISAKEALAAEAEQLATSTQWKASGDRLRAIIEEWKAIKGVDRKTDDVLWKRFSSARDAFSKARGSHFAQLDKQREAAKQIKLKIVAEAEELSTSTDWGPTASRMKSLMSDWKAAGRAPRDSEDALWAQFRAAQDAFFAARSAVFDVRDSEQLDNKKAKEQLLESAERINPATQGLDEAKSALRDIQDKWEQIGHVPRDSMRPLEDRLKRIERRVRDAEDAEWKRSAAESNPILLNMRAAVTKAETVLTKAEASGDAKKIDEARQALDARREWLAEAEKSVGN